MNKKAVFLALIVLLSLVTINTVSAEDTCETCHPGPANDYALSSKSEFLDCADCHGSEHMGPETSDPTTVTPKTCERCHEEKVSEFSEGKHALGWEAMVAVPTYHDMPEAVTEKGCVTCHSIGYIWEDGSQGRCDTCHTRHLFSADEAREPELCGTCHAGDHPHYEMWENSKHGMLYATGSERAPTCVTCHDSHNVITAWGFLGLRPGDQDDPEWYEARQKIIVTMDSMGPGLAPNVMRDTYEEWEDLRENMIDRCEECHSESYARRELEKGDNLLRESDLLMANLIDLANMLYDDGVIDNMTRFGIYREGTANRFSAYMGGFHNSAKFAWDEGYLALAQTLVSERDAAIEAKKISMMLPMIQDNLLPLSTAGVVLGVIGIAMISWYWYKNRT